MLFESISEFSTIRLFFEEDPLDLAYHSPDINLNPSSISKVLNFIKFKN